MDAFEKLAKLAGASVESVGEGLPRTRAEALALGVTRYFTGKPCQRGHVAWRYASGCGCCECAREREATPERKERRRQYSATPERKEYDRQRMRRYLATPNGKERERQRMRQRNATPEFKEYMRQCQLANTGDAVLFAVNQAEQAARMGRATKAIGSECPEPQRSQLQALVDRIRADPQAGKAVVGLLRTMRELRKAELAEMRAGLDESA